LKVIFEISQQIHHFHANRTFLIRQVEISFRTVKLQEPALIFFIFCDSLYYQHLTLGELHMMHLSIDNFVFTPWNFIKANLDSAQTASHGVHPCYVHLMVNMPMLFNVLALASLGAFAQLLLRFFRAEYQVLPRFQSIVSLMSGAIFVPLFFLSLINHQEPRFLLPVTFPLILLHAPKLITGFSACQCCSTSSPWLLWEPLPSCC